MSIEGQYIYARLRTIGDALGNLYPCSFDKPQICEAAGAIECLRLWSELTRDKERTRALDALRQVVD